MSEKIVRFKYKSDIINCIEESWDYYGEEDEQRKVIKEFKNVYKISSSARNTPKTEYEVKAKILDRVKEFATEPPFLLANNEHEDYELYAYDQILRLIEKYESGGYDAKNDEVDYCAKCTVKPIVKEHMCDECYAEHCQWLSELSAPKQDSAQWYTLYESKA